MVGSEKNVETSSRKATKVGFEWWMYVVIGLLIAIFSIARIKANVLHVIPTIGFATVPNQPALFAVVLILAISALLRRLKYSTPLRQGHLVVLYTALSAVGLIFQSGVDLIPYILMTWSRLADFEGMYKLAPILERFSLAIMPKGNEIVEGFWIGSSTVPWSAWIVPLILWTVFFALTFVLIVCSVSLVFDQWNRVERLTFPLAAPVVRIIKPTGSSSAGLYHFSTPFWKDPAVWLGLLIGGIFVSGLTGLKHYFPGVFALNFQLDIRPYLLEASPAVRNGLAAWPELIVGSRYVHFDPITLAIGFLLPLDLSFSVWFAALLYIVFRIVGYNIWGIQGINDQGVHKPYLSITGLLIGVVLYNLWVNRTTLKAVFLYSIGREKEPESSSEFPIKPKTAFFGSILSFVLLVAFSAILLNLSVGMGILFFLLFVLFVMALARIRAESGLPLMQAHGTMFDSAVITELLGSQRVGSSNVGAFGFFIPFTYGSLQSTGAYVLESLKMADECDIDKRRLTVFLVLVLIVAAVVSMVPQLTTIYTIGGVNTATFGQHLSRLAVSAADISVNPKEGNLVGIMYIVVGAVISTFLYYIRGLFVWWPFHPLGLIIAVHERAKWLWPSMFIAWIVKFLMNKYGGRSVVEKGYAFAIGVIVGISTVNGLFSLIGAILGY